MDYLASTWTQQDYPADKKWLLWRNPDAPKVDLYTEKAKQRGVIKEPIFLIRVVVQETEGKIKIMGVHPRPERSGQAIQGWLTKNPKDAVPKEQINWTDDGSYPY